MDRRVPSDRDQSPEQRLRDVRELLNAARELVAGGLDEAESIAAEEHRLATEYELTAALYRRRAARRPEDADRFAAKAEWFERRAQFKRAGAPMPRELRTPSESVAVVDGLRRALASAVEIASDLTVRDLRLFRACLLDHRSEGVGEGDLEALLGAATKLLGRLGATRQIGDAFELGAYSVPLVESAEGERAVPTSP
jgi:hypothetical protein